MLFGDLTLYLAAIACSYLFFVFCCGALNPFVKPKKYLSEYRRIRYFRYVALALVLCSILSLLAFQKLLFPLPVAAIGGSIVFILLILPPSWRYFRRRHTKTPEPAPPVELEPQPAVFEISRPPASYIKKSLAIARPAAAQTELSANTTSGRRPDSSLHTPTELQPNALPYDPSELQPNSSPYDLSESQPHSSPYAPSELLPNAASDEYALEMDIKRSTAHINDNLIDMDQSIVEAEFETLFITDEQKIDAAIPDFMDIAADNQSQDPHEQALEQDRFFLSDDFGYSTPTDHTGDIENYSQATKIAVLERENASLSNAHETLKGQIAQLELGLRHKDATVRKSIAQKEQALQIKEKALAMAAMERKKRKLTEVKAQKIVMRLKQNLRQLELDQHN